MVALAAEHKRPENYDPRSLYERLQEQKDKKQEEYDEKLKFSMLTLLKRLI